jgi:hypothetical protein
MPLQALFLYESPVKEGVVNCVSIWEQYHPQISSFHLWYWRPAANPAIRLNHFLDRVFNDLLNLFHSDHRSIGA